MRDQPWHRSLGNWKWPRTDGGFLEEGEINGTRPQNSETSLELSTSVASYCGMGIAVCEIQIYQKLESELAV